MLQAWVQQPRQVATVCPSSPAVTDCLANRECVRRARTVVDLGPGTGCTTSAILRSAAVDARILAIEKTASFIKPLRAITDPRLTVVQGDAIELEQLLQDEGASRADVIVSGIPFSAIPPRHAAAIMGAIHNSLEPGGVFIAYQVRRRVVRFARPYFGEPEIETVWLNLPPLQVFTWEKRTRLESGSRDQSASPRDARPPK